MCIKFVNEKGEIEAVSNPPLNRLEAQCDKEIIREFALAWINA